MAEIERTSKLVQGSAHRVGAWVKLIQKDMGVATGKLAGQNSETWTEVGLWC